MTDAEVIVLDRGAAAAVAARAGEHAADLGGRARLRRQAEYHLPFLAAVGALFCDADELSDPVGFLRSRIASGATFAVCTLGADGAVAVDADGETYRVDALPVDVVDTNGAGDAFFAGVLAAAGTGIGRRIGLDGPAKQTPPSTAEQPALARVRR